MQALLARLWAGQRARQARWTRALSRLLPPAGVPCLPGQVPAHKAQEVQTPGTPGGAWPRPAIRQAQVMTRQAQHQCALQEYACPAPTKLKVENPGPTHPSGP